MKKILILLLLPMVVFSQTKQAKLFYDGQVKLTTNSKNLFISTNGTRYDWFMDQYGKIGIGTSNPTSQFTVNGVITATGGTSTDWNAKEPAVGMGTTNQWYRGDKTWQTISIPASQWIANGSAIYYNTGNIGMGTSSPAYKLDIVGNMNTSGSNAAGYFVSNGTFVSYGNFPFTSYYTGYKSFIIHRPNSTSMMIVPSTSNDGTDWDYANGVTISNVANVSANKFTTSGGNSDDWNGKVSSQWTTNSSKIYYNTGNVGIGTTSPNYLLCVVGTSSIRFNTGNAIPEIISNNSTAASATITMPSNIFLGTSAVQLLCSSSNTGALYAQNSLSLDYLHTDATTHNSAVYIMGYGTAHPGYVGIGMTNPGQILEINGNIQLRNYGSNPVVYGRRYNGTVASPTVALSGQTLFGFNAGGCRNSDGTSNGYNAFKVVATEDWSTTANGYYIPFTTVASTTINPYERMRITDYGTINIGDGTSISTTELLDVHGNIKMAGYHKIIKVASTPTLSAGETAVYTKGNYYVIAYMDGATAKYRYFDQTGTANPPVWVYSTTAP